MSKQKIESNDLENISGGKIEETATPGMYWMDDDEANKLREKGFQVSLNFLSPMNNGRAAFKVLDENGNMVDDTRELKNALK